MKGTERKPLRADHSRFVTEYLVDFNATAAAGRAGYSLTNRGIGRRLMRRADIAAEISRQLDAIEKRLEIEGDDVRRGLAAIARDPREAKAGGPSWEARIAAWRELGKLLGLYTAKVHVTGSLTLEDLLLMANRKQSEALDAPSLEKLLVEANAPNGEYPSTEVH